MNQWIKNRSKSTLGYFGKITNAKQIRDTAYDIKDMSQTVLSPKRKISNARVESFQEAVRRQGVNNDDLQKIHKNFALMFYTSAAFGAICFAGAIYNFAVRNQVMGSWTMAAILLFCLANMFKFSFRAFQIRSQELFSAAVWWNCKNEWLPPLSDVQFIEYMPNTRNLPHLTKVLSGS